MLKETRDKPLLESIYKLLTLSEEADKVFTLTIAQKANIRKGLKNIEDGKTISHLKAKNEVAKWLLK